MEPKEKLYMRTRAVLRIFATNLGFVIVSIVTLCAIFAPLIAPYDPIEMHPQDALQPPNSKYLLGTDLYGRDVFSRTLYGSRTAILISVISILMASIIGPILGIISGYFGGLTDFILTRILEIILSFPMLVFAILLVAVSGTNVTNVILVMLLLMVPIFARVTRAETLAIKEKEYIEAAKALGYSKPRIIFRHILPNCITSVIVIAFVSLGGVIIIEASLSFLGLGTQPPAPSWGYDIHSGISLLEISPWVSFFPGLAIMLTIVGFNLMGDYIRDIFDPTLRAHGFR